MHTLHTSHKLSPDSPLLEGLFMKELRGNPLSPGMSNAVTAIVAIDFCASFLLGHWNSEANSYKDHRKLSILLATTTVKIY